MLLAVVLSMGIHTGLWEPMSIGTRVLVVGMFVNILLAIFNLIPIPPLDGSRVVQYFLPPDALMLYRKLEQFGLVLIFFLVYFIAPVNTLLTVAIISTLDVLTSMFGLSAVVSAVLRSQLLGS